MEIMRRLPVELQHKILISRPRHPLAELIEERKWAIIEEYGDAVSRAERQPEHFYFDPRAWTLKDISKLFRWYPWAIVGKDEWLSERFEKAYDTLIEGELNLMEWIIENDWTEQQWN